MTIMLLSVRNTAELPNKLYSICQPHCTSHHITSHHTTSHHTTSCSHHATITSQILSLSSNLSDGCLTELQHSCSTVGSTEGSTVGSNCHGAQQLLATAAAEYVLQHSCTALPTLCTTSNSAMSLPAWYQGFLACHLVCAMPELFGADLNLLQC